MRSHFLALLRGFPNLRVELCIATVASATENRRVIFPVIKG
jgi:hypothetical protein